MTNNVTSLTGNGLKDWLIQRVSALYLAGYALALSVFLVLHPRINYMEWSELFRRTDMRVATVLALLMLLLHAWIGIWTVTTDYIKHMALRLFVQLGVAFWLLVQFIWGLMIMWGK